MSKSTFKDDALICQTRLTTRLRSNQRTNMHTKLNKAFADLIDICYELDLPTVRTKLTETTDFMSRMIDNA